MQDYATEYTINSDDFLTIRDRFAGCPEHMLSDVAEVCPPWAFPASALEPLLEPLLEPMHGCHSRNCFFETIPTIAHIVASM